MIKKLLCKLRPIYNRLPFNNYIRKRRGLKIKYGKASLTKCRIENYGRGNEIIFLGDCNLRQCQFLIYGNDNIITIGNKVRASTTLFRVEDDGNDMNIGDRTIFIGDTNLTCIEGTKLHVGKDCLFALETVIRTGDGHSILNMDGVRINPSQDVILGNHIWLGNKVTIQKGCQIADNCIVGTNAVATKIFDKPNCALAGIPAKILRENVSWEAKRI